MEAVTFNCFTKHIIWYYIILYFFHGWPRLPMALPWPPERCTWLNLELDEIEAPKHGYDMLWQDAAAPILGLLRIHHLFYIIIDSKGVPTFPPQEGQQRTISAGFQAGPKLCHLAWGEPKTHPTSNMIKPGEARQGDGEPASRIPKGGRAILSW